MTFAEIVRSLPTTALRTVEDLPLPKIASGKVREIYDAGEHLLMVTTDRLSAFDVILPDGIPGKGIILNQIALHWFRESAGLIENHLVPDHEAALRRLLQGREDLVPRCMLVKRLQPLAIEAVVRGYLSGSGWKDYLRTGTLFGQKVPEGLKESDKLPFPVFTPTTKGAVGTHDEPLSLDACARLLGEERFRQVRDVSLKLFGLGTVAARRAGIILADTKFEFGTDASGKLYLIDEVLTPDSSRFWPAELYRAGGIPPSFDKQFVRDYLESIAWDKNPPAPRLPDHVVFGTRERYLTALEKLLTM